MILSKCPMEEDLIIPQSTYCYNAIDSMTAVLEYFRLDSRITLYRWDETILRDVESFF